VLPNPHSTIELEQKSIPELIALFFKQQHSQLHARACARPDVA